MGGGPYGVVLLTAVFRLGALKSWTRVPLIRGSYMGSSLRLNGSGRRSGTCWLVFLLINRVDIGFLRKGKPFFGFCCSRLVVVGVSDGRSEARRVPAGRRPAGPDEFCKSVGVLKDVVMAFCGGGRIGAGVWRGAKDGRDFEELPSELRPLELSVASVAWASLSRRYFLSATPPRKPESPV